MRNCTYCGNQVKDTDKFCSNCGARLNFEESFSNQFQKVQLKICDFCGEENSIEANGCQYCGVRFSGKEKIIEKEVPLSKKDYNQQLNEYVTPKSQKISSRKQKKTSTQVEENQSVKKLDTKSFFYILIVIIAFGLFLIYYGTELQNTSNISSQNPQQESRSRIDLNALNEINQLENEIKNDPDNQQKLLKLANLSHDAGFFEKAITYYQKYLKLNPQDNDAEVDMGVCYFEMKNFEKASAIFENVIKKNPNHQIAYLNLGIVTLTLGDVEKSKEFFKKCVELGEHTEAGHRAAELLRSH